MTPRCTCNRCELVWGPNPEPTPEQVKEAELVKHRAQQSERARVAKFMGCSIEKVVRGRDGGWTTR